MTILTCPSPSNINPLNPNGFLFSVTKLPELTFFVQDVELPSLTIGTIIQSSSVHDIKIPGETADYGSLTVSFLVDEQFANYKAIYAWMIGLTYPETHAIYTDFLASNKNENSYSELAKGYSDATLTILDSSNNPIQSITFVDAYPTSLSSLPFSSQNSDAQYLRATATFEYTYYKTLSVATSTEGMAGGGFGVVSGTSIAGPYSRFLQSDASGNFGSFTAGTITANLAGNATTATKLQTARTINGVSFDGTSNITIATGATAETITGTTLASNVTGSSLTSVGTLGSLAVTGAVTGASFNSITGLSSTEGTALGIAAAGVATAAARADHVHPVQTTISGNANNVTGVVAITNGGTGATTAVDALTALGAYAATNPSGYTSNTGTVTSVGGTGTVSGLTLTGSVITSGSLTLGGTLSVAPSDFSSQTANTVLSAPNGTAGTPTFRALVAADIPNLDAAKITSGTISASLLPSYVDDVIEVSSLSAFPVTGETGKIYVALDTNKTYRWSGSVYVYITSGAVDSVAGKTGVVTLTSSDVGLGNVENKSSETIRGEITSSNVTTALGFTPYNNTNPSGYTTNTGTVTSVGGSGTVSGLTLSGTVTTSGSLSLGGTLSVTPSDFSSQTANTILAAPNGSSGTPSFRALVASDVPTLNQNTSGTAAGLSATLAITSGGTGETTASAAFNSLSPITTTGDLIIGNGTNSAIRLNIGANSYVLTSNGTTATWQAPTGGGFEQAFLLMGA